MSRSRSAFGKFLMIVGALSLLAVALAVALAVGAGFLALAGGGAVVSPRTVLALDLETALVENAPDDPLLELLGGAQPAVRDIVDALARARDDDRVDAVLVTLGGDTTGMAVAQEIRDAIADFRTSGKPAWAFAETFGEGGPGNVSYYIATACDRIHLQPSGDVGLVGLSMEAQFLRGTFEKLEITPEMDHRYAYKNAMNTYTERQFTPEHREAMQAVLDSHFGQLLEGIADGRDLEAADVRKLVDRGPFLAAEALDAKLVDELAYRDEVRQALERRLGGEPTLVEAADYLGSVGRPDRSGAKIALIYGVGTVVRGESAPATMLGSATMGSDTLVTAFREAAEDEDVKAIVFRIDSPGGSYVASDAIWRAVARAQAAGKPVIASMGNVAGSGGYFVAMGARKIVAQPATITGSIGVLGGKMVMSRFFDEKLGVTFDEVHSSANSLMYSSVHPYSDSQWARHQAWLDRVYEDFTFKAAKGREMDLARLRAVAQGRIWTGQDALRLGLVDELGGMPKALELAREAASLDKDAPVRLAVFPEPPTLLDYLLGEPAAGPGHGLAAEVRAAAGTLRAASDRARELGLATAVDEPAELQMPYVPMTR